MSRYVPLPGRTQEGEAPRPEREERGYGHLVTPTVSLSRRTQKPPAYPWGAVCPPDPPRIFKLGNLPLGFVREGGTGSRWQVRMKKLDGKKGRLLGKGVLGPLAEP